MLRYTSIDGFARAATVKERETNVFIASEGRSLMVVARFCPTHRFIWVAPLALAPLPVHDSRATTDAHGAYTLDAAAAVSAVIPGRRIDNRGLSVANIVGHAAHVGAPTIIRIRDPGRDR